MEKLKWAFWPTQYTYIVEYYLVMKKEWNLAICSNVEGLESIMLSEMSQREIPHDFTYMWNQKKNKTNEETEQK